MIHKSYEDFIKYIYEELSIDEKGLENIDPYKLHGLLFDIDVPIEWDNNSEFIKLRSIVENPFKNQQFKNVEAYVKYIYDKFSIEKNGNKKINLKELNYYLEHAPTEFADAPKVKEIKNIATEFEEREYYTPENLWAMPLFEQKSFSIDESILTIFGKPEDDEISKVCEAWIGFAQADFIDILSDIYEPCRWKSINLLKLAEMELRELNRFFDHGISNSMAVNVEEDLLRIDLSPKEIFHYYLQLLRGDYDFFIKKEEYRNFVNLQKEISLQECKLHEVNGYKIIVQKDINYGRILEKFAESYKALNREWWLAARVQALLWLVDHLEKIIKSDRQPENKLSLPKLTLDDLVENRHGFQVNKPKKTLPEMYRLLVEKALIIDEGQESFIKAFQRGEGTIEWISIQSQLGYFIKELKKGIVFNPFIWKTASNIFRCEGKPVVASTLKTGAAIVTESRKTLIDDIIQEILSLY